LFARARDVNIPWLFDREGERAMPDREEPSVIYARLVKRAWSDPDFKAKLLADPASVLDAAGFTMPAGVTVKVVEDTDHQVHLVLPPPPDVQGLPDDALDLVAAGLTPYRYPGTPPQPPQGRSAA
jgi:hypothetical protein